MPEHYDAPAFGSVEENLRLKLQAFRLGDIILGSCACEAQVDLILNFESRANDVENDIYDGFDWACVAEDSDQKGFTAATRDPAHAQACAQQRAKYYDVAEFPIGVPGDNFGAGAIARMRAQVHNPANGWDAPEYVPYANAEPSDSKKIKGNFTKEELPAPQGYKIAVGIGHAGDYNGYTVSYREYMSHDHYRKALTSYGAHTADYMVTRLVRMAGAMKGAPELRAEPHDTLAQADEARQVAVSTALGQSTRNAYEAYFAALPPDAGPKAPVSQPSDLGYFKAATFTWQGGSTATDNPRVVVQQCDGGTGKSCVGGNWKSYADQTGEVQTRVTWPTSTELPMVYAGQFKWKWTANFEAYEAFPARMGSTPAGVYRFAVEGCINDGSTPDVNFENRVRNFFAGIIPGSTGDELIEPTSCRGGASRYTLQSNGFEVIAAGEVINSVTADAGGDLSISVSTRSVPRSYASVFPYINTGDDFGKFCRECTFRPWAISDSPVASVSVDVGGAAVLATGANGSYSADTDLTPGQSATITVRYQDGRVGRPLLYTRSGAPPVNPPAPVPASLPLTISGSVGLPLQGNLPQLQ